MVVDSLDPMPRRPRFATGGYVYHVLNRAVGRARLFEKTGDYLAFQRVLEEAREQVPMRLLAFCVMPNHWHLVVWPLEDGDLSEYMRWLTVTHTQRWGSPWQRMTRTPSVTLAEWPVPPPRDWLELVNQPQTDGELQSLRRAVLRGSPYGDRDWQKRTAKELSLESTLRPLGRPRKTASRL